MVLAMAPADYALVASTSNVEGAARVLEHDTPHRM